MTNSRQLPIRSAWRHASLAFQDFSRSKSITFTSLQQRQSIFLASFLQCPHLHQSRFLFLICNKSAAVTKWQLKHIFSFQISVNSFQKITFAFLQKMLNVSWEHSFNGNAHFVQNRTFGLWEKMISQLRKLFCKIPLNTCATTSVTLLS